MRTAFLRRTSLFIALVAPLGLAASCGDDSGTGGEGGTASTQSTTQSTTSTASGGNLADNYSEAELTRMVSYLASDELNGRDEGTAGGQLARTFIIDEMTRCGIQPGNNGSFEQKITAGAAAGTNIIGVIPGTDPTLGARSLIISAHYDHIGGCGGDICNGADDNAAGVGVIVGVGCALAKQPLRRSVIVASWDSEEPPTFLQDDMGSKFYADNPTVGLDTIDAVLVLDLVGGDLWPGYQTHFMLGSEYSPQTWAVSQNLTVPMGIAVHSGGLHLAEEQPIGHQPWSDYDAFRNLGRPVLFFSNGQNKRYHTPQDEMATINVPKMALEAQVLFDLMQNLDAVNEPYTFDPNGADYLRDAKVGAQIVGDALAPGGLVDGLGLNPTSRATLEDDLAAAQALVASLEGGGTATMAEIRALRDGTQHIMCLAGSTYPESVCSQF